MRTFIAIIHLALISFSIPAQTFSGKIIDEKDQPVEYATVAIYSLPDSMLSVGTVSNAEGGFSIKNSVNLQESYLKISYVGYETLYVFPIKENSDIFRLIPDNKVLDEVVVERTAPSIVDVDGRLVLTVKNSPFQRNYTASDLLVRTPFLSLSTTGVAIDGGAAELRINGVKQNLTGSSLLAFLNSLKSENIKQIAVQMGRTADLSADLPGGVIDIILEEKRGLNGNVYAELNHNGRSYEEKRSQLLEGLGGAGITMGTDGLHFYANVYGSKGKFHGVKSERNSLMKDVDKAINTKGVSPYNLSQYYNANAGLSYTPNENNIFIWEGKYSTMPERSSTDISSAVILQDGQFADSLFTQSYSNSTNSQFSISGSHNWKSSQNNFTINSAISYLNNKSEDTQNMHSRYKTETDDNSNETGITSNTSSMFYVQSKIEYTFENKLLVLTGLKYTRTERESDYSFISNRNRNDVSSNYKFTEELPAVFGNLSRKFENGLFASFGVRGEYTRLYQNNRNVDISYFDLFPSASLSYRFKNNISLNTSYSRSIFRPSFTLLNNYTVKLSDYIYSVGNPTLKAQVTDNINVRLSTQRHSLSARYSYSANPIMESIYSENGIIYIKNMNTGKMHTTSFSYGHNGNLSKKWFLSVNAGVSHISLPGNIRYKNIVQGYATAYNTVKLSNHISSNINIRYASPWIMNDRKVDERFSLDLEIRYAINAKLSLDAGVKNLLRKNNTTSITDNLYTYDYSWRETAFRSYTIRLTYNFSKGENIKSRKVNDENTDRFRL